MLLKQNGKKEMKNKSVALKICQRNENGSKNAYPHLWFIVHLVRAG